MTASTDHLAINGGEGGMVVTDDLELARRARAEAHYGNLYDAPDDDGRWKGSAGDAVIGYNLRMTEMQSAIGLAMLDRLDASVAKRRELAHFLTEGLADSVLDPIPEGPNRTHSYFRYDTLFDEDAVDCSRDEFVRAVGAEGVPISAGSSFTNHRDPRFDAEASCPVSEEIGRRIVTTEVYPTMDRSDCEDILAAVAKVEEAFAV